MFGFLTLLLVKLGVMLLPLTVLGLAFRRLMRSRSANAWLYASTVVFASVTTVGLVPWTFGFGSSHPIFVLFSVACPVVWYGVVSLCNQSRQMAYDSDLEKSVQSLIARLQPAAPKPPTLVLEGPEWPSAPLPLFRHSQRPGYSDPFQPERAAPQKIETPEVVTQRTAPADIGGDAPISKSFSKLLDIARTMRANDTSENRRVKFLPAPDPSRSGREIAG